MQQSLVDEMLASSNLSAGVSSQHLINQDLVHVLFVDIITGSHTKSPATQKPCDSAGGSVI